MAQNGSMGSAFGEVGIISRPSTSATNSGTHIRKGKKKVAMMPWRDAFFVTGGERSLRSKRSTGIWSKSNQRPVTAPARKVKVHQSSQQFNMTKRQVNLEIARLKSIVSRPKYRPALEAPLPGLQY
jgi:hypothetical protein